jgi:hypothetical protein
MSFNCSHPGVQYGQAALKGPAVPGQILKLVGNDQVSVVSGASDIPIGVLSRTDLKIADAAAQGATDTTPCVISMNGSVITTDQFTGTPAAGNLLTFDASTAKFKVATTGSRVVGQCLSTDGTEITVLWSNTGETAA